MSERPPESRNFCRVFELPEGYPKDFCFGGALPVTFGMVDWFSPWPEPIRTWAEVEDMLRSFVLRKPYVKPGRQYLVLTTFGKALVVDVPSQEHRA